MMNDETIKKAQATKIFDLEERTGKFAENTIDLCKSISPSVFTDQLVTQLIRAASSVGANYCEADDAYTKKDFYHKISICRKESRECKHWLRLLKHSCPNLSREILTLWNEAKELNLIFSAIINRAK
jgi:four helix bundle protein